MYISYHDLQREQARPLDYKIGRAVDAIRQAGAVSKHRLALAFSGGKDSTVLWHLIRTHAPELATRMAIIYGNTTVEYPECVKFARRLGREWAPGRFYEAQPGRTASDGYTYAAQREILAWLIETDQIRDVLKEDGKLKSTIALERAAPPHLVSRFQEQPRRYIWPAGTRKNYWWSVDQYGWPLMGKARSRLKARRINIDCFLHFSESQSDNEKLLAYYETLRVCKFSQACCDILKKEPSERVQAELGVDVIFKGLMAAESRPRMTNFVTRGYLFESHRPHLGPDSFWHCNPLSIWNDDDIWMYINRHHVPYASLYNMGWTDKGGTEHRIKRNGCIGCATDILFPNNHMSMLRRTHPRHWRAIMDRGMASEIQNLQRALRNGQMSLFDVYGAEHLLDRRPCIFDRVDKLVLEDDTLSDGVLDFDPETEDD